jgi:hypothetical protein
MKAIRLTRNKHYRKLKMSIYNISDWLINADVLNFYRPLPYLSDILGLEDSSTFRITTITYCLPRQPAASYGLSTASHDNLLPLTNYLLPFTTTYYLPRLSATSHDYLLP